MSTDSERLQFLIKNRAYVDEHFGVWKVFIHYTYDEESITPHTARHTSPEAAIDEAMEIYI